MEKGNRFNEIFLKLFRAELGTEEYIPYCDMVLENFVVLKKNPNYNPEEENVKVRHKKSVS